MNTNTYILPEQVKITRIRKLNTLKAIMRLFFITNFHCKIIHQNSAFSHTGEGQSSSGNGTV